MVARALLMATLLGPVAAGVLAQDELDPPILLLGADRGITMTEVSRTYGPPEMRTTRAERGTRRDELVYRINEREMVIARFVDLKLEEVARGRALVPTPARPVLTNAQLKRRGRTSVVRLGWTAQQAAAWLTPDGIVPEAAVRESDPGWKGGEIWVYRNGPYLTEVTVREEKVVEIVDILLDAGEAPRIAGH